MGDIGGILAAVSTAFSASMPYISTFAAVASVAVAWMVYRDQSSPDVIVYVSQVSEGSSLIALYVENIGPAPAYDVSFEVSGELPASVDDEEGLSAFLGHDISLLMPGARRGTYLGVGHQVISKHGGSEATIAVRFARRRGGKRVKAEFPIEVLSFEGSLVDKPLMLQKVEEIAKQSKRVADGVNGIKASLQSFGGKMDESTAGEKE